MPRVVSVRQVAQEDRDIELLRDGRMGFDVPLFDGITIDAVRETRGVVVCSVTAGIGGDWTWG